MARRRKIAGPEADQKEKTYLEALAKEDPTAKTRAAIIKDALKTKRISVHEILQKTGLSMQMYTAFMAGRTNLRPEHVEQIAKLLGIQPEELMTKQEPEKEEKPEIEPEKFIEASKKLVNQETPEMPSFEFYEEERKYLNTSSMEKATSIVKTKGEKLYARNIGAKILEKRNAKGIGQRRLGEQLGYSEHPVRDIERGNLLPTYSMLCKAAIVLNFTRDEFNQQAKNLCDAMELRGTPIPISYLYKDATKTVSASPVESIDAADDDISDFVPSNEEIIAMVTLMTEAGRKKAYSILWEILKGDIYRKGGV